MHPQNIFCRLYEKRKNFREIFFRMNIFLFFSRVTLDTGKKRFDFF